MIDAFVDRPTAHNNNESGAHPPAADEVSGGSDPARRSVQRTYVQHQFIHITGYHHITIIWQSGGGGGGWFFRCFKVDVVHHVVVVVIVVIIVVVAAVCAAAIGGLSRREQAPETR